MSSYTINGIDLCDAIPESVTRYHDIDAAIESFSAPRKHAKKTRGVTRAMFGDNELERAYEEVGIVSDVPAPKGSTTLLYGRDDEARDDAEEEDDIEDHDSDK